jgi:hypothetical protein
MVRFAGGSWVLITVNDMGIITPPVNPWSTRSGFPGRTWTLRR